MMWTRTVLPSKQSDQEHEGKRRWWVEVEIEVSSSCALRSIKQTSSKDKHSGSLITSNRAPSANIHTEIDCMREHAVDFSSYADDVVSI